MPSLLCGGVGSKVGIVLKVIATHAAQEALATLPTATHAVQEALATLPRAFHAAQEALATLSTATHAAQEALATLSTATHAAQEALASLPTATPARFGPSHHATPRGSDDEFSKRPQNPATRPIP